MNPAIIQAGNHLRETAMRHYLLPITCVAALLSACGGGNTDTNENTGPLQASPLATASTVLVLENGDLSAEDAQLLALPSFHMAPVVLDTPESVEAGAPVPGAVHRQTVPYEYRNVDTRRLTMQELPRRLAARAASSTDGTALPAASGGTVATYTPAQIRAAYGLPTLPASFTNLTATQAAQLGAGQTIYIVDARHDPNVAAELAAFNSKFGLPACATKAIAAGASLPLPAASRTACEFSVVYSTAAGAMTATVPPYDAGWATEIALDVQWAHATAPLARIVLIEANSPSYDNLLGGVKLANNMGPGVVSMSFGGAESAGTGSADATFSAAGMSYLAATGDSGAGVAWPSVSAKVLAVGGTTLTYSGAARSEVVWSGTGGGTSAYVTKPAYQSAAVPGMDGTSRRTVADVAFNADPNSGQYVALIASGTTTVKWTSVGGTSLATPQWAGLIAVANALRAQNAKAALGAPHAALYTQIASVPGTYAGVFADVTAGSHGTCTTCAAKTGYDAPSGLGTPKASSLLGTLSGLTVQTAPVVTAATINGKAGTALTFTASVTSTNAVTYSLSGAPAGMTISGAGVVGWTAPVAGTYGVTVTAKDGVNGLSGSGVYTVVVAPAGTATTTVNAGTGGPVIKATALTGVAGRVLSGSFSVTDAGSKSMSVSISGAPLGMMFSASGGTISMLWASPVTGGYQLKVVATNGSGISSTVTIPVTITAR
jgi:hypothetical protein